MWDNLTLSSLPVPHLSSSWATVMVLGKGSVPTSVPVSAELQPDCMLASAQEDSYPSGLLPSIGPSSQRQGSLQNCPLYFPGTPLSAVKTYSWAPPHIQSLNILWKRSDVNSLCQNLCCLQPLCCSIKKKPWSTPGQPSRNEARAPVPRNSPGTKLRLSQGQKQEEHGDRCHCLVLFLPESVISS